MIHGRPLSCFIILWLKYLHGFAPHDFINLELRHHQYVDALFVIFLLFLFIVRVLFCCSCSYLLFVFLFIVRILFIVRVLFMVLIYFIVADALPYNALPYNALPYNDSVSGFLSVYYCSCKAICFVSISKSFALKIFILLHF